PEDVPHPPPPPPPPPPSGPGAFYTDLIGDAFMAGGLAFAVGGVIEYRKALDQLDAAEAAPAYNTQVNLLDDATSKRKLALVLGASSVVLIGIGVYRYIHHGDHRDGVAVVPTPGGAAVAW